jgi:CheY-like chemotaxis protein
MFTQEMFSSNGGVRRQQQLQPAQPPSAAATARPRVLLVEDERVSRRALSALLSVSGYPTEAVASAEDALRLFDNKAEIPRIALVDLNLPGMSGLDLIERLERLDPSVYVVLITAQGGESLLQQLHRRGVAYLQKPVNFDRLLTMIAERQRPH